MKINHLNFEKENSDKIKSVLGFKIVVIFLLIIIQSFVLVSAINDLFALQGNVQQSGINLASGDVRIHVYDAVSGGNLVYNSSDEFNSSISSGKYDILIGNSSTNELSLEYGKNYYLELYVNGEVFDFGGSGRQMFQSSVGNLSLNDLDIGPKIAVTNDSATWDGGYNITMGDGGWFKGMFNFIIDTFTNVASGDYLGFNGTDLTFKETMLNQTIDSRGAAFNETGLILISNLTTWETTYNATYAIHMNITDARYNETGLIDKSNVTSGNWVYNQSLSTREMWNATWDQQDLIGSNTYNATYAVHMNITDARYNETGLIDLSNVTSGNWVYNQSLATQEMWNATWDQQDLIGSNTYNATYAIHMNITDARYNETGLIDLSNVSFLPYTGGILTGNLNVSTGGLDVAGDAKFNAGWENGGVSIIGGDVFAKTLYVYNITSLSVSDLSINGSISPGGVQWNNTFDLGISGTSEWKYGYFGTDVLISGTAVKQFLYNQSLATFEMYNATWDSSDYNKFGYNQSLSTQEMWNATWDQQDLFSNYNATWDQRDYIKFGYNQSLATQEMWNATWDQQDLFSNYNATWDQQDLIKGLLLNNTMVNFEKVGVGVTIPTQLLEISTGGPTTAGWFGLTANDTRFIKIGINVSDVVEIGWDNDDSLAFGEYNNFSTDPTFNEFMRIDANGNVGIGTTAPAYLLEIANSATALNVSGNLYVNSTNVGIGTGSPDYSLAVASTDASNQIGIYHDNTDAYFKTDDGSFIFQTDEGTDTRTYVDIKGKGTGWGEFRIYDQDNAEYLNLQVYTGVAAIWMAGTAPGRLSLQHTAENTISMFESATSGETPYLSIVGYRAGDAKRTFIIAVGDHAADTVSFYNVGNYYFDGNVGVGTTAPAYLLEIANSATALNVSGNLYVNSSNVGIGTVTPSEELEVVGNILTNLRVKIGQTDGYQDNMTRTMRGVELTDGANSGLRITPAIKFMSADTSFTTENPKLLAGIYGKATEAYTNDSKGGMELRFATTPNNPGAENIPVDRMVIQNDGDVGIGKVPSNLLNLYDASPGANEVLFNVSTNGGDRFTIDEDGDVVVAGNIVLSATKNVKANYLISADDTGADTLLFLSDNSIVLQSGGANNFIALPGSFSFNVDNADIDFSIDGDVADDIFVVDAGTQDVTVANDLIVGTIAAGGASAQAYNIFGTGAPDEGDIADGNDVFISDDLEINGYGWFGAGHADIAEKLNTKQSRENENCNGDIDCLKQNTTDNLDYGDVVCIDKSESQVIIKCAEANSNLVVGVISNTTVLFMGETNGYPIAVAGVVFTHITNENGDIEPGDLLVTSLTPGYAMKGKNPKIGTVIGKSYGFCNREDCDVLMFVALS